MDIGQQQRWTTPFAISENNNQMIMPPNTHKKISLLSSGNPLEGGTSFPADFLVFSKLENDQDYGPHNRAEPSQLQTRPALISPNSKAMLIILDPAEVNFFELLVGFLREHCFGLSTSSEGTELADDSPMPIASSPIVGREEAHYPSEQCFLSPTDAFLAMINQLIELHLEDEDFRPNMLAKSCYICEMQLYRRLKKLANLSPANYIRKYRLCKSKCLLSKHMFTISEIGCMVGFRSLEYFSRSFKAEFGICPKAYREMRIGMGVGKD